MKQVSLLKRLATQLAECELFGTPEQYKELAAQLRKRYGKSILRAIIQGSQISVGSYLANIEKAKGQSIDGILSSNRS